MTAAEAQIAIATFAVSQDGKGYDRRGIYGFLARKDLQNADRWFCSELVAAAFLAAQIPLLRRQPHKTAPGDLRDSPLLNMFAMLYTKPGSRIPAPGPAEIRVALYDGHSLVSRGIKYRTWSDYSHASIILPDGTVVESIPFKGVVHHPYLDEFHKPQTLIEIYTVNWPAALLCRGNIEGTIHAD